MHHPHLLQQMMYASEHQSKLKLHGRLHTLQQCALQATLEQGLALEELFAGQLRCQVLHMRQDLWSFPKERVVAAFLPWSVEDWSSGLLSGRQVWQDSAVMMLALIDHPQAWIG